MTNPSNHIPHVDWERVDPDDLSLPDSRRWLDYWRSLAEESGAPPSRERLNVIGDRPSLAPLVLWAEVLEDGDYFYRVMGELVRHYVGFSLKGKKLSEIDLNGSDGFIARKYAEAVSTGRPVCSRGRYGFGDQSVAREAVVMPFAEPDGRIAHLLIGMAFK